jgi:hypothetical protein
MQSAGTLRADVILTVRSNISGSAFGLIALDLRLSEGSQATAAGGSRKRASRYSWGKALF